MPELPEVETVCRGLQEAIGGKIIARLELRRPDMRIPFPPDLPEIAAGRRIENVTRRAKYALITLDSGNVLIAHLGMSGKLLYHTPETPRAPALHDHAVFHFSGGSTVVFNDPRRFGLLTWAAGYALNNHAFFRNIGPDPLQPECTVAYLQSTFQGRRIPIKLAIMDQRLIAGVGNIYACEALYRSRLSPWLPAGNLDEKRLHILLSHIQDVLLEAIESGGSTLRDYVRSSGDSGYFQHHFAVYGRDGKPCTTCQTPIKRTVLSGRSTFHCPECQYAEVLIY